MSRRVDAKQAARVLREQLAAQQRRQQRTRIVSLAAVGVLVLAGVVGLVVWRAQTPDTYSAPPGVTSDGGTDAGIYVAGEGPVRVEVYLDFLCPACRQFELLANPTIDELLTQNKITLVWHTLGFLDAQSTTDYSTRSASSAGCASAGGKLKEYGEALYARQPAEGGPGLSDDELIAIGGTVGLTSPTFAECVRDKRFASWVAKVNDFAAQRGVNSTPTVFVAGKQVDQPTPENLRAAVAAVAS